MHHVWIEINNWDFKSAHFCCPKSHSASLAKIIRCADSDIEILFIFWKSRLQDNLMLKLRLLTFFLSTVVFLSIVC